MNNVIVYVIGPPGVGKYSVGKLLAARMPAKLLDNHYWCNPIFEIIEPDGRTPLPPAVWDRTSAVLTAVLETVATLAHSAELAVRPKPTLTLDLAWSHSPPTASP
jgi:hypothetical protein